MKIESLFVPDSCLQGDEFPAHITWDKSEKIEVMLKYPKPLEIKKIYNVPRDGIKIIDENSIKISKFDVNGYVGFVLGSKILDDVRHRSSVKFEIKDMNTQSVKQFLKEISFFRPALESKEIPSRIKINYNSSTRSYRVDKKIKIINVGDGTAIIAAVLASNNDSDFERLLPKSMDTFITQVFADMETELEEVKENFPDYSSYVNGYLSLAKPPISLDDKFKQQVKSVSDSLYKAFEDDEDFFEEFSWAIGTSYFKNIHLVTEIRSFMNYLYSIGEGKVLLANYIDVLKPKKSMATLRLEIRMTDLAYRSYPPLELPPIEVICEKECEIPIHVLFDWTNKSSRE